MDTRTPRRRLARRLSSPSTPTSRQPGLRRRDLLRGGACVGLGLSTAGALSACGGTTDATVESGKVPLELWTHDDGYIDFFTEAIPVAEERSKFAYDLSITKIGASDLVTKLIAQAVAGTGTPDVAGLEIGA